MSVHVCVCQCMCVYVSACVCVCVKVCCVMKRYLKRVVVYVKANTNTCLFIRRFIIDSHLVYVAAAGEVHIKFIARPWPVLNIP